MRDRCDRCGEDFAEGEQVFRYTMLGSAAEFDGVAGERIFLHAACAVLVTRVLREGSQAEQMKIAHQLAMSIREEDGVRGPCVVRYCARHRSYEIIDQRPHYDREGHPATLVRGGCHAKAYPDARELAVRWAERLNAAHRQKGT